MKYIKKIPSSDKELSNKLLSEGWKKIKEHILNYFYYAFHFAVSYITYHSQYFWMAKYIHNISMFNKCNGFMC